MAISRHIKLFIIRVFPLMEADESKSSLDLGALFERLNEALVSKLIKSADDQAVKLEDGLFRISSLEDSQETTIQEPESDEDFFSQIPNLHIDNPSVEASIANFKLNYVTSRRKDELFKRYKKDQEQQVKSRKNQFQGQNQRALEIPRGIKGEYALKKGDVTHFCSIQYEDLEKLRPETDLNDTIIANYIKYMQVEVFSDAIADEVFIHSSFFFGKLLANFVSDDIEPKVITSLKEEKKYIEAMKYKIADNYKNVERWTKKIDIFQKKYVVIPINLYKHWFCIMVANPGSLIEENPSKKPYLIYCDSMGEKRNFISEAIRRYLELELQKKKGKTLNITYSNLPCYQILLPRQTNTHDCGMYMLVYLELLLSRPSELENLHKVENRKKLSLFPRKLIDLMRNRLIKLFIDLINATNAKKSNQISNTGGASENIEEESDPIKKIIHDYHQQTLKIVESSKGESRDFDQINQKEFKKYWSINSYVFEGQPQIGQTPEEMEYACLVRFYTDPEVNFYEKDHYLGF